MRYLIKFSKESNIKFVSHLDIQRTIQRNFKRSGLNVEYSKGFNPHILMSVAQPLAVGMYSKGEYMDVRFNEETDEKEIIDKLNDTAPSGIKYFKALKIKDDVNKKVFKSMAAITNAKYVIKIKYTDSSKIEKEIKNILSLKEWFTIKKSKKSEKTVDIKPMVKNLKYSIKNEELLFGVILSCGSRENLSAEVFAKFIKENTSSVKENSFVDIQRLEMFGTYNKKAVSLYDYAKLV